MIAGQLRPERAFDPEILACNNRARVGQKIAGIRNMGPDRAQIIAQHQQGHVVFAHDIVPGHQLIARGLQAHRLARPHHHRHCASGLP